jgi:2-iminobutanoate/2-iminopropanoate deaminase
MEFAIIEPTGVHSTQKFAYSHAVRMGSMVFVAGQVAYDRDGKLVGKGDALAQTEQVFRNLEAVLKEAGSGLDKVGKMTVFTTRLEYRPIIHQVRARVFEQVGHYPASTLAVVSSLADPDWLVEIEAVAMI